MELDEELIGRLTAALPFGDVRYAFTEGAAARRAAIAELASDDLTTAMISSDGGLRADYTGIDGFMAAWQDWVEPFDSYEVELEDIREGPNGMLVLTRQTLRPRGTSASIEGEAAGVLTFTDSKLTRIEFHLDRSTARRAAGLE